MGLREAPGDCERHQLPGRGTYGLLEAALACERHTLTSPAEGLAVQWALAACERRFWRPRVAVGLYDSEPSEI